MNDTMYDYWLCSTEGIGIKTMQLLNQNGLFAKQIYEMSDSQIDELSKERLLSASIVNRLKAKRSVSLEKEYDKLTQKEISVYFPWNKEYPLRLKRIPDPPLTLYVHGTLPPQDSLSVAIVGARCCSPYGSYVARELGALLGQNHISVVSGLASGIDGISQKSAAYEGGNVYAVLGCGVDICYPASNKELYNMLWNASNCGIMSEYIPRTKSKASLFPPRNRIISGLSDVVVVIEAKLKSGTLITVDMALEQGKEVYALPGRITDRLSDGCNRLLKDGAQIFLSPELFLAEIQDNLLPYLSSNSADNLDSFEAISQTGMQKPAFKRTICNSYNEIVQKQTQSLSCLSPIQNEIYVNLELTPLTLDDLCLRMQDKDPSYLLYELTLMQIAGHIKQAGAYFMRVD